MLTRRTLILFALLTAQAAGDWQADPKATNASSDSGIQSANAGDPLVTIAWFQGKKLFVVGDFFDQGAVILIDGMRQKTRNDDNSPVTLLIAKKAGKKIPPDQTVTLVVQNQNGLLSEEITIYSGCR